MFKPLMNWPAFSEGLTDCGHLRFNFYVVYRLDRVNLPLDFSFVRYVRLNCQAFLVGLSWQEIKELNPVLVGWSHLCYRNTYLLIGALGETRTPTLLKPRILSPLCLPFHHKGCFSFCTYIITQFLVIVNP